MSSMPHCLHNIMKQQCTDPTLSNHPQKSLTENQNGRWSRYWHNGSTAEERKDNIVYGGRDIQRHMTPGNLHRTSMPQNWSKNSLKEMQKEIKRPTWMTHFPHTFKSSPQIPLPLAHYTLHLIHQSCLADPAPLKVLPTFNMSWG